MSEAYETARAAAYLAFRGFRIFPIAPRMKGQPLIAAWPTQATNDAAQVMQWWPEGSQNNIGIVGGNGRLILDVDWRKPGCREALAALEAKHGALPTTYTVSTPSGGEHRYFEGPDVLSRSDSIGPGLDIKSRGGYVVAPWSFTVAIEGKQSAGYYVVKDELPIAKAPAWLIELAGAAKAPTNTAQPDDAAFKLRGLGEQERADLTSALNHLATRPEIAGNQLWSEIGYALKPLGDEGREIWCKWSEDAPGYGGPVTPDAWWDNHGEGRSDYRHIFTIAQGLGWINPRSNAAKVSAPPANAAVPAPSTANRFTPVDAWAYADGADPQWRIEGLLPEQGLAMIFGASGAGKSFFALDLTMVIARGQPFGFDKRKVTQGGVVYVLAEGAAGYRKRLRAYRNRHRLPPDSPAPRLVTVAPNLMNATDVTELQAAILADGRGADVIVIDTLHASAAGADENSAKDMGQFLGHCRTLQAATGGLVILIHHSGKDEERGARGSSALRAAMDTEIEVSRGTECSIARVTKQRDGDDSGAVCFKLVPVPLWGDKPTVSAAVEHVERPAKARKERTSKEQSLAVEEVRECYPDGVHLPRLVTALQAKRPDLRADSIKRSVSRAIDTGLLSIDSSETVRLVAHR